MNKKNINHKLFTENKKSINSKNISFNKKNIINQNSINKISNLTSKYNKIITSLNNKINNSEFINNENELLILYYNELYEFWNSVIKIS